MFALGRPVRPPPRETALAGGAWTAGERTRNGPGGRPETEVGEAPTTLANTTCFPGNQLAHDPTQVGRVPALPGCEARVRIRGTTVEQSETTPPAPKLQMEKSALDGVMSSIRAVRKHWAIVLGLVLVFGAASLAYSKTLPKIYEAQSLLEFDPDVIKPLGNKADPMVGWSARLGHAAVLRDPVPHHAERARSVGGRPRPLAPERRGLPRLHAQGSRSGSTPPSPRCAAGSSSNR